MDDDKKAKLAKRTDTAYNKKRYLLGEDEGYEGEDKTKYWLEAPSWDCGWYWGFGYVGSEHSHQHIDGLTGEGKAKDGGYCHNLFDCKLFAKTTFSSDEGWKLSELFAQFYHWKEHAEVVGRGGCHITEQAGGWHKGNEGYYKLEAKKINEEIIPEITKRILKILTPKS